MTRQEIYDLVHSSLSITKAFTFTYDTPEQNVSLAAKRFDTEQNTVDFISSYSGSLNVINVTTILSFVTDYLDNYNGEEALDKLNNILSFIRIYIPQYVDEILNGVVLYNFDDLDDFCVSFFS